VVKTIIKQVPGTSYSATTSVRHRRTYQTRTVREHDRHETAQIRLLPTEVTLSCTYSGGAGRREHHGSCMNFAKIKLPGIEDNRQMPPDNI